MASTTAPRCPFGPINIAVAADFGQSFERRWCDGSVGDSVSTISALQRTPVYSRAQRIDNEAVSSEFRRKSRAISQLAFWAGAGSTPAASTIQPRLLVAASQR